MTSLLSSFSVDPSGKMSASLSSGPKQPENQQSPISAAKSKRRRKAMEEAGKSKTGLPWGPSHSMDSDDTSRKKMAPEKQQQESPGNTENTTKTPSTQSDDSDNNSKGDDNDDVQLTDTKQNHTIVGRFLESMFGDKHEKDKEQEELLVKNDSLLHHSLTDSIICSPCKGALEQPCFFSNKNRDTVVEQLKSSATSMAAKADNDDDPPLDVKKSSSSSSNSPAERRRQRHAEKLKQEKPIPMDTLEVDNSDTILRNISELTMKSSYGEATAKLAENRRMAYYAVGKHHKNNSGRGGNRRCYFTGKLILGGAPFYAGSVQQGLRTLVVFCLPSALGLPKKENNRMERSEGSQVSKEGNNNNTNNNNPPSLLRSTSRESNSKMDIAAKLGIIKRLRTRSRDTTGSRSRLSSLDDMSLSIVEEDLDPNWGLDRDYLLERLPEPDQALLQEMEELYPEQFETLPVQVRSDHCWRLFVKFCFFSGLPIAEGESHYKVRDQVAMEVYGEEIILSHDVMEAVNGDSAEILRLPNQKTFRYLRKHYTQQCSKLSDAVFCRRSWELVRPEI